ncbi:MAG: helix-turn-helix domain-containing protein [Chloroflexota bacterium]
MQPDQLRARRKALGLSQARLALHLDCHQQQVAAWESGRAPITPKTTARLMSQFHLLEGG